MKDIWEIFINSGEVHKTIVDVYDRIPNVFYNHNILEPSVSQYLFNSGFQPAYPGNKKFAVAISHDIDSLASDDLNLISIKHYGGVKSALKLLKNEVVNSIRIKTGNQIKNYIPKGMRNLASIEEKYKIPASYYFLSLLPDEEDFNYNVNNIKHIFDSIKKLGGEIGLHGGHLAYNSAKKISEEKKMLETACNMKIMGYRNHYLRFDRNVTWNALAENNFLYDTTYGDASSPGFRNGMCYPFNPYDTSTRSFVNIIEVPLIYMDCSPLKYLFLNEENGWRLFCDLVEKVRKVNGVFTLLWHNTSFDSYGNDFYYKAIAYLKNLDPWFATGHQIAEHYKEQKYLDTINNILTGSSHERV